MGGPLVVEVDVRTELLQDAAFVHAAEREGLVDGDVPVSERGGETPLCRAVARGDDGGSEKSVVVRIGAAAVLLHGVQAAELGEEVGEGAGAERDLRLRGLGFPELVDAAALEDLFGAVVGEHAVEVECHAELVVVHVVVELAVQHIACGEPAADGVAHVGFVAGEEERDVVGVDVVDGMAVGQERRARDVESVMVDAAEHAVSGVRVVVAEEDDLDRLGLGEEVVELEESPDERERDAGFEDGVLVFALVLAVGGKALAAVDLVGDIEAEERAGRDRDDELVFDLERHVRCLLCGCSRTPAECGAAGRRR